MSLVAQKLVEDVDFLAPDRDGRGQVGALSRLILEIEDADGGYGVEGEAGSQVVGMAEPAILDAGSGFEGLEVQFDGPSPAVPFE
ncbi:MAG: hypothetical protein OXC26_03360, partial [Albidovulum sp.]|nr:hypothetical protein [Albidovulum sp.]